MKITKKNSKSLNDENNFKFGYLCIKHAFQYLKFFTIQTFKNSEERRPIETIEFVEKWLENPKSVSVDELKEAWIASRDASKDATNPTSRDVAMAVASAAWDACNVGNMWGAWDAWDVMYTKDVVWVAEQKWQKRLLDYIYSQQELSKNLNIENIDDPLNFVRGLIYKINYEGLNKCLGLRSLVYKHLKEKEEFSLCMDYLKSHNFFT